MWRTSTWRKAILASVLGGLLVATGLSSTGAAVAKPHPGVTFTGHSNKITNRYLPITKFHRCVLGGNDQGQHLRIVRVLQNRTKRFTYKGRTVKTAVVKDRVTDVGAGQLIEKTVDYFAQTRPATSITSVRT